MAFFIDPEIIKKTNCEKEFDCLQTERKYLCKVEVRVGDNFYMNCHHNEFCSNQEKLPGLNKCHCLVRKAIYENYGI